MHDQGSAAALAAGRGHGDALVAQVALARELVEALPSLLSDGPAEGAVLAHVARWARRQRYEPAVIVAAARMLACRLEALERDGGP
jgi:hypothetical protein